LVYILTFPIVGLGMLAWTAIEAQKKKAEAQQTAAPAKPSALKTVALMIGAPVIGLAFVVAGPIIGLGLLLWFGFQAWAKFGAKAIADNSK
jgi:threonine/homoserine/homoserine lactone efflux protein